MQKKKLSYAEEQVNIKLDVVEQANLETVDFNDINRPKTCLEVDFPIIEVNQIATIEGNAGKPIYQMSKWWARRRSSVFRAMILAAATKAPDDILEANKVVWNSYYKNHQNNEEFSNLNVADIFMGGGTTIVEGSRLGMNMIGNDLNPVAWMVVKNELSKPNKEEVKKLVDNIELKVKPQIMPYYKCDCPRGHKGKWLKFEVENAPINPYLEYAKNEKEEKDFIKSISTFYGWSEWYKSHGYKFEIMDESFDIHTIKKEERKYFRYWGPEVIYTFWVKYAECGVEGCNHRTPIIQTPIVSVKQFSIKYWSDHHCSKCNSIFDIEEKEARMSPEAEFIVSDKEKKYTVLKDNKTKCPHCGNVEDQSNLDRKKLKTKKVSLSLIISPEWIKGHSSLNEECQNKKFGGTNKDTFEDTKYWNEKVNSSAKLIEYRGSLPKEITLDDNTVLKTNDEGGTSKGRGKFVCSSCGTQQQFSECTLKSGKDAPMSIYAIHGYCPECDSKGEVYNGRFFKDIVGDKTYDYANKEWNLMKEDELKDYWPKSEIPFSHQTHQRDNLPSHGYKYWYEMFNSRQLLILSQLLKEIDKSENFDDTTKMIVLGAFQQYLRNQNMFCIWNKQRDTPEPHFSNNNYHPKMTVVENGVFSNLGRGNWNSCISVIDSSIDWSENPWELVSKDYIINSVDSSLKDGIKSKSMKVYPEDSLKKVDNLTCGSSSELTQLEDNYLDLIITDPPFGDNVQYAELADFFYVWLRLVLKNKYPNIYSAEYTPKTLEAVSNRARHSKNPDGFYKKMLTECWKEANRTLKPAGILAFTFHHSEDEPWIAVLESLFEAGFYLEATYPIRSDEIKGEKAEFGSKKIEYDIIHVCKKRYEEPKPVSWAKMRREVVRDIKELQEILENHQKSGLPKADLEVIQKGKALEYFSKHYGAVYVEKNQPFSVREALIGINQLINDESDKSIDVPPKDAEVLTRSFLRIFDKTSSISRDEITKYLRGTAVGPSDFINQGWCIEKQKTFYIISPVEILKKYKEIGYKKISSDYDQAMCLIGACYTGSGVNINNDILNNSFKPRIATENIIKWICNHGSDSDMRIAAQDALKLYSSWEYKKNADTVEQIDLFRDLY